MGRARRWPNRVEVSLRMEALTLSSGGPRRAPLFTALCLTTLRHLDVLGFKVIGEILDVERAVLDGRVVDTDLRCPKCGCEETPRATWLGRRRIAARTPAGETADPVPLR